MISAGSQDLLRRICTWEDFPQDLRTWSCADHERTSWRGARQDPHKNLTRPVQDHARTSQGGLCQDLHKSFSQGPVQDPILLAAHFLRACAVEMHLDISEGACFVRIYRKNAAPQKSAARFVGACAVENHLDI